MEDFLSYIFRNFFGHILIAISVVLAALTFTRYGDRKEEKLTKILSILQTSRTPPDLPGQFAKFTEKGQKDAVPTPSSGVKKEFQKMTRHDERIQEKTKVET